MIYTSGTTGRPKGVMVEHANVVNYTRNIANVLAADIKNIDFSTKLTFDLSVTTTISALLLSKKVCIYPGELSDIEAYIEHLIEHEIDFVKSTPSLLENLPTDYFDTYHIKQAFVGGEKLTASQLGQISKYIDSIIDEYGPTEATVGVTAMDKSHGLHRGIGKPYGNCKAYVLDNHGTPVPIGVVGELHIAGAGVARGYLNMEE
ncbi:AMP-binding protein, partial [Croceitalea sp. MTPC5]|uniref:AMP-binding protein n=1 Tax=Croceitalea sp. MTPC5 TaxID=3056565 RepID=UPI0030CE5A46